MFISMLSVQRGNAVKEEMRAMNMSVEGIKSRNNTMKRMRKARVFWIGTSINHFANADLTICFI